MTTPTPAPTPVRRRRVRRAALVVAGVTAGLLVVPALTDSEPTAAAAELVPFGSCDELDSWYREMALELVSPWGLTGDMGGRSGIGGWLDGLFGQGGDDAVAGMAAEGAVADSARSGEAVGPGATGTNVQEEGVDEPDIVKTDGRRVVTLSGSTLHVLETDGTTLRETGTLELSSQWAQELVLLDDRALVVSQRDVAVPMPEPVPDGLPSPDETGDRVAPDVMPAPEMLTPTTVLTVVDLSDSSRPRAVRTEELEAGYLSARVSGGAVRVVLSSSPVIPFTQPEYDSSGNFDEGAAEDANRAAVEGMSGADWLPHRVVRDDAGTVLDRAPAMDCAAVTHPVEQSGMGMVTVLTMDASSPDLSTTGTTAVSADGGMVYASTDRLYVATTRGGWGFPMPIDVMIDGGPRDDSRTQLHGFDTGDAAGTTYVASGSVPGYLLGRWAMSARDGMLRVATTTEGGPSGTEAVVTVLAESDGTLAEVGSVGGLGKTEQIRAVRWFGDLAVVVTFRQTDPLYTVDLSDPTAPVVMGELKIPGYSAYLHPLGEGMLLGVGQDATDTGQTTGTQVSSFDLRDLAAPARVDTLTYRNSWSDVEGESRAFSYLPDERLALLPLSAGSSSGVVAVDVGQDGALAEAGRWTAGRNAWVLRATPVGGDAVVVLAEGERGRTLTLLGTPALTERDSVDLG